MWIWNDLQPLLSFTRRNESDEKFGPGTSDSRLCRNTLTKTYDLMENVQLTSNMYTTFTLQVLDVDAVDKY